MDVATLYVRKIPAELYAELQRWAQQAGQSINAEVIDLLQREAARRRRTDAFALSLEAYFEQYAGQPVASDAVALIREDRDRGHKPELGY